MVIVNNLKNIFFFVCNKCVILVMIQMSSERCKDLKSVFFCVVFRRLLHPVEVLKIVLVVKYEGFP